MAMPANIENYAKQVEEIERTKRGRYNGEERRKLASAKLNVAVWACKNEGVPLSRFALTDILGPDMAFVFANAPEELLSINWETAEDRELTRRALSQPGRQKDRKSFKHTY